MNIFTGFKNFILRGNVLDLAVGVVIGASFNNIVTALVRDIITPIIGIFSVAADAGTGTGTTTATATATTWQFANLSFSIHGSTFMYGDFINALLSFLIVALSVYFLVVMPLNAFMNKLKKKQETAPAQPPVSATEKLLTEIRDLLKSENKPADSK